MSNTTIPTGSPTLMPTMAPTEMPLTVFVESSLALGIAFGCSFVAICISGFNIFKHLLHYSEPALQKSIVRILLMVPFYALLSFLSLSLKEAHVFLDSVRDIYEAFVVYCFLNLILGYCGGENTCLSVIMQDPGSVTHIFPLNCCFGPIALTSRFLRACKQGTLQFVIIKPVMALLNLILVAANKGDTQTWDIVQAVIYNTSYTLALYSLVMFYKATHSHPGLRGQYPVLKFLSVKLVIFATYYQTVLVGIVPGIPESTLESFNDFLLCAEMVPFAILQYFAFSYVEFADKGAKRPGPHIATRNDSTFDPISVAGTELPPRSADGASEVGKNEAMKASVKDVMNVQDVAKDAYYNFSNKYGEHVLLDSAPDGRGTSLNYEEDDEDLEAGGRKGKNGRIKPVVVDEDDVNPFAAQQHSSAQASQQVEIAVSPSGKLPAHSPERDPVGVSENPFAADMADPFRLSSANRQNSFGFDNEAGSGQDWTADFSQDGSDGKVVQS